MKILILSFFLVLYSLLYSQGNLQFNAVKRFSNNVVTLTLVGVPVSAGSITVPANKVWKIESGSLLNISNYPLPTGNYASALIIDNQIIFAGNAGSGGGSLCSHSPPIWLPSGTYTIDVRSGYYSNSQTLVVTISAIEFNIIP